MCAMGAQVQLSLRFLALNIFRGLLVVPYPLVDELNRENNVADPGAVHFIHCSAESTGGRERRDGKVALG